MPTRYDKDATARCIEFFSYKSYKEWAKSKGLNAAMGAEMLNSLFRAEAQSLEKILAEQVDALLAENNLEEYVNLVSHAKGPMIRILAQRLKDSQYAAWLSPLLEKYHTAEPAGQLALLSACEKLGDCSHLDNLKEIENKLASTKKPDKGKLELARKVKGLIIQIGDRDNILALLKTNTPSLQAIQDFSIEDLHPRLAQLSINELLSWLKVLKEYPAFEEQARNHALSLLAPSKSKPKPKMSASILRYCTTILAFFGAGIKDKVLIDSVCKLSCIEQQQLFAVLPPKVRNEVIRKLFSSPSNLENGIRHLEQHHELIPIFKDSLVKAFETGSISAKVRAARLLLRSKLLPTAKTEDFVKRTALYMELADHWQDRAEVYLELLGYSGGREVPVLHRCKKRDALLEDLHKRSPDSVPNILIQALDRFTPQLDSVSDLVWLLEKLAVYTEYTHDRSLHDAVLRELRARPDSIELFQKSKPVTSNYRHVLATALNEFYSKPGYDLEIPQSEQLHQYTDLSADIMDDWLRRSADLLSGLIFFTRLGMADLGFRKAYSHLIEINWPSSAIIFLSYLNQARSNLDMQRSQLSGELRQYRVECLNRINKSIAHITACANQCHPATADYIGGYFQDCLSIVEDILVSQEQQLDTVLKSETTDIANPEDYLMAWEQVLFDHQNLQSFIPLQYQVNLRILMGISLNIERAFICLQEAPIDAQQAVQACIAEMIYAIGGRLITEIGASNSGFDPAIHRSNQDLQPGDGIQIIFPGICMNDGTLVRHAMVK